MEIVERASKPPAEEAPDRQQSSRESAQTLATTAETTTTTFANDNDSTKMSENQREAHTAIAACIPYIPNHQAIEERNRIPSKPPVRPPSPHAAKQVEARQQPADCGFGAFNLHR